MLFTAYFDSVYENTCEIGAEPQIACDRYTQFFECSRGEERDESKLSLANWDQAERGVINNHTLESNYMPALFTHYFFTLNNIAVNLFSVVYSRVFEMMIAELYVSFLFDFIFVCSPVTFNKNPL